MHPIVGCIMAGWPLVGSQRIGEAETEVAQGFEIATHKWGARTLTTTPWDSIYYYYFLLLLFFIIIIFYFYYHYYFFITIIIIIIIIIIINGQ